MSKRPAPIIVAHRGLHKTAPENSWGAMRAALIAGFDWVECDVWNSLDSIPIVIHDETLDRTTNGHGKISEHRWVDLKRLELKSDHESLYRPELLPDLAALRYVGTIEAPLVAPKFLIEVKPADARHFIENLVHPDRWFAGDILQSFDEANLIHALSANPRVPVAYLIEDRPTLERAVSTGWDRVHIFHELLDPSTADWLQNKGITYAVWTPNTAEDIRRACRLGAAMIITDEPVLARNIVECEAEE